MSLMQQRQHNSSEATLLNMVKFQVSYKTKTKHKSMRISYGFLLHVIWKKRYNDVYVHDRPQL